MVSCIDELCDIYMRHVRHVKEAYKSLVGNMHPSLVYMRHVKEACYLRVNDACYLPVTCE